MAKTWIVQPSWEEASAAGTAWGVSPLIAQMLHDRGVTSADEARTFLAPQLAGLLPPETLHGADRAAELLADAVRRGQRIVLYGDYDVDGITGVAILWHTLTLADADVSFYVPHRLEEGYGLNADALRTIAAEGAQLVVSIDCGVTAVREAEVAREIGLRLIVTDHHEPQEHMPDVEALVHPHLDDYANPHLCGAGVAFKLAWAFARQMTGAERVAEPYRDLLKAMLPLAALGTVADVVPLVGENRILARCGLAAIKACPLPGVQALLDATGLQNEHVDGVAVGFRLAPRINAAGRMGHARLAIELLTRADADRAREIAFYLDEHNKARRTKERQHTREACAMIEQLGLDGDAQRAIVLAGENWHAGVIGIVASRIVDRYHKPTVLISLQNGTGQGSARSVPHFALHEALAACDEHLIEHGGHAMAAGLKIKASAVGAFTEAFTERANNALSGSAIEPKLRIESEVVLSALDERTVVAIRNLEPFGEGNPKPLFATGWIDLVSEPRCVGKSGEHVQLHVSQDGVAMKGIAFRAAGHVEDLKAHRKFRVAFEPIINTFKGRRQVEMQVVDFKFPDEK